MAAAARRACSGLSAATDRHRLAVIADAVDGEHRLVGDLEAVRLRARHVGVRQHGVDAGESEGCGDIDPENAGVGVRAADGVAPEHAGRLEIARERELALGLGHGVGADDALADAPVLEPSGGGDGLFQSWRTFVTHTRRFPRYAETGRRRGVAPGSAAIVAHVRSAASFTASTIF